MSVNGQVLINMKTKITSYGPHNGIIVHYGVQQEPNMFWPCTLNGAPNSLSSQRFDAAPTFATIHWPTIEDSGDDRRNKGTPCMSNRYYHLTDENGTSSNVFEKVRLNVFETVRFHVIYL